MDNKQRKLIEQYLTYAIDNLIAGLETTIRQTIREELARNNQPKVVIKESQQIKKDTSKPKEYLTSKEVCTRYNISPATLWRWVKGKGFPKQKKLGQQCSRWKLSELLEWESSNDR